VKPSLPTTLVNLILSLLLALGLCSAQVLAQQNSELSDITVREQNRQYRLFVPTSYDKNKPMPLVLNFHGTSGTPAQQVEISDIETLAAQQGFIAVSPAAIYRRTPDGPNTWNVDKDPLGVDDVLFVKTLIAQLKQHYNIDNSRIYAMGFSGGARMSSRLACDLSAQIAAIGPVAGVRFAEDCQPSRAVPVITFHGKKDGVNHYVANENSPPYWRMGVEPALSGWVDNNHCAKPAQSTDLGEQVTRLTYSHCQDHGDVVFYQSASAGHTWPGSKMADKLASNGLGASDKHIPATELIWAFFKAHPLQ
jgi:polyhydroxybutyrate depolymerase